MGCGGTYLGRGRGKVRKKHSKSEALVRFELKGAIP